MTKGQLTGLAGTPLVAAQLTLKGFNPVVTSRNMKGIDILVENPNDGTTSSIQVKPIDEHSASGSSVPPPRRVRDHQINSML